MQTSTGQGISGHAAARYGKRPWREIHGRTDVRARGALDAYLLPAVLPGAAAVADATWFFFRTREEAEKQGLRACLRCRPNEVPGAVALVQRAVRQLADSSEESIRLGVLASALHKHASDAPARVPAGDGLRPRDLAEALRIKKSKRCLRAGKT